MTQTAYYYSCTLAELTKKLGPTERVENPMGKPTREHLAWMVEQVAHLDRSSLDDALKAARWIGWMLLAAEIIGFWSNSQSRALIRLDREAGFDKPTLNIHS